jgi:hypothetical protein
MINDGINNVPDNTIAVFAIPHEQQTLNTDRYLQNIKKPEKKRDWFPINAYHCLPLTIGNQYGFVITTDFAFNAIWNGGKEASDTNISFILDNDREHKDSIFPFVRSDFGHGIITVQTPFVFRTPPGINLMTVNPPNYILNNITTLTGVVETDNIRMPFTFNLKIQEPNRLMSFPKGTPIVAFVPIQRYFVDKFSVIDAKNVFNENIINEELEASRKHALKRENNQYKDQSGAKLKEVLDRHYMVGEDIYGNKFNDHQRSVE